MNSRLTHNEFCEKYQIVSITGRCYGLEMLLNSTMRKYGSLKMVTRADIKAVLDDPEFMKGKTCCIPAYVCKEAWKEALIRSKK